MCKGIAFMTILQTTSAESLEPNEGLAAIRALKIDGGTITRVERDASPTANFCGHLNNNVPPRTIVRIVLNPAKGSNINVEMTLPDPEQWSGRLLGTGNGGAAGGMVDGLWMMTFGWAVVTTDMGTAPNPQLGIETPEQSGIGNPEVWKDFGFRATHLMTVAAKQVIKAYYGKAPDYSYFLGGSTGGQQGLQEAQRYPGDYEKIPLTEARQAGQTARRVRRQVRRWLPRASVKPL